MEKKPLIIHMAHAGPSIPSKGGPLALYKDREEMGGGPGEPVQSLAEDEPGPTALRELHIQEEDVAGQEGGREHIRVANDPHDVPERLTHHL